MDLDALKAAALKLPMEPGVYIMKNEMGAVIYVGKAKKLKNRVTQYFQDTANHTPKTRLMVSKVRSFDVIVAASEFEALVLECSLIKRHQPKYNILLKDDKGYPYLRLNMKDAYPSLSLVSKIANDKAEYFGPFGSRGVTNALMKAINSALKLPDCGKQFPRDIGKGRPCLNYHMNVCAGWCQEHCNAKDYRKAAEQARQLLLGNYKTVVGELRAQMLDAAENLNFELAATLRDKINALDALSKKQLVTAGSAADTDVIGLAQTELKACFTVLHFSGGNLVDKDYEVLTVQEDPEASLSALVKQYYLARGFAPKHVLLPFAIEDSELFEQLLQQQYNRKTVFHVPVRGDKAKLVALAKKNATEEAERVSAKEEKSHATVNLLAKMLGIPSAKRIESFDISNLASTDIVASMVVFQDGKPLKSNYKRFKIEGLNGPDDYSSMEQVVRRRFLRYKNGDKGFGAMPDLLLIDGGIRHAAVAVAVLNDLELSVPVFGMVKDDRHRTRALVTADGKEIGIDSQQAIFALVGNIQEETHRFAITYHKKLRSKRLRYSQLDEIPGIGAARKELLLKTFKSVKAISEADLSTLERYLPKNAAYAVYAHFKKGKGEEF